MQNVLILMLWICVLTAVYYVKFGYAALGLWQCSLHLPLYPPLGAAACRWKVELSWQQGLLFSHTQPYQLDRYGEAIQLATSET